MSGSPHELLVSKEGDMFFIAKKKDYITDDDGFVPIPKSAYDLIDFTKTTTKFKPV